MSESMKWACGVIGVIALFGLMIYFEIQASRRQSAAAEKYKVESLEYAKQGWVYVCGWNCRWERIKP